MRYAAIAVLVLTSCRPEPVVVDVGPWTQTVDIRECSFTGFCCSYGLNFDLKYRYSCEVKPSCGGKQTVTFKVRTVTVQYPDTGEKEVRTQEETILRGVCR